MTTTNLRQGDTGTSASASFLCNRQNRTHWVITLNRPEKRNALSDELVGALLECMAEARSADIPVLVFNGCGKNFSAGFDFSDFDTASPADLLWRFVRVQQLLTEVETYPGLTVGVAHGRNFGAGCDLFGACSVRLATEDARFRMPGVLFGLVLGTRRMGDIVGESNASRLLLSAREFDFSEALGMGFVTGTVDDPTVPDASQWGDYAALSPFTRKAVTAALGRSAPHQDMGRLVESIMQGDIKERLRTYLGK